MSEEMKEVAGVSWVLGLNAIKGAAIPEEISGLCFVFSNALSQTRSSEGKTVTQAKTPNTTPFAITTPKSIPSVKLIKQKGAAIPEEMAPDSLKDSLQNENWQLLLIGSRYKVASDEVNNKAANAL